MKLHGYCTDCHRFRWVRMTSSGMARLAAGRPAEGVCDDCVEVEERRRQGWRRRV